MHKFSATLLKTIAGLAVAGACASASAENWQPIGSSNGAELLIDADSIQQDGDMRQAWSMWNFKEPRKNNDPSFPTLKSYKDLQIYNCKDQTARLAREIIYSGANGLGDERDHSDALANSPFNKPKENTVAYLMMTQVCGFDLSKK